MGTSQHATLEYILGRPDANKPGWLSATPVEKTSGDVSRTRFEQNPFIDTAAMSAWMDGAKLYTSGNKQILAFGDTTHFFGDGWGWSEQPSGCPRETLAKMELFRDIYFDQKPHTKNQHYIFETTPTGVTSCLTIARTQKTTDFVTSTNHWSRINPNTEVGKHLNDIRQAGGFLNSCKLKDFLGETGYSLLSGRDYLLALAGGDNVKANTALHQVLHLELTGDIAADKKKLETKLAQPDLAPDEKKLFSDMLAAYNTVQKNDPSLKVLNSESAKELIYTDPLGDQAPRMTFRNTEAGGLLWTLHASGFSEADTKRFLIDKPEEGRQLASTCRFLAANMDLIDNQYLFDPDIVGDKRETMRWDGFDLKQTVLKLTKPEDSNAPEYAYYLNAAFRAQAVEPSTPLAKRHKALQDICTTLGANNWGIKPKTIETLITAINNNTPDTVRELGFTPSDLTRIREQLSQHGEIDESNLVVLKQSLLDIQGKTSSAQGFAQAGSGVRVTPVQNKLVFSILGSNGELVKVNEMQQVKNPDIYRIAKALTEGQDPTQRLLDDTARSIVSTAPHSPATPLPSGITLQDTSGASRPQALTLNSRPDPKTQPLLASTFENRNLNNPLQLSVLTR